MPLELQVKILRLIQEREIEKVAGRVTKVDVRIIVATHRNCWHDRNGTFREIYYPLAKSSWVASLRERPDDVPERCSTSSLRQDEAPQTRPCSSRCYSPTRSTAGRGTARSENVIERMIVLSRGGEGHY